MLKDKLESIRMCHMLNNDLENFTKNLEYYMINFWYRILVLEIDNDSLCMVKR